MAAKVVQVSDDAGVTWHTLPGGTGGFDEDAAGIDDTIFGYTFQSNEKGLVNWKISGNAIYKGFAGYKTTIKKQGTSTLAAGEACALVSGKRYRISDSTKNLWDRSVAPVVKDGGVDHTSDVQSINYLFGEVVFKSAYTVTGAVTVDVNYFPLVAIAGAKSYTLTQTAAMIDRTTFSLVQSDGEYRQFDAGLRTVRLELGSIFAVGNPFAAALRAGDEWVVEINADGNNKSIARGFFRNITRGQSGDVGALEEESVTLSLNVPNQADLEIPFAWQHDATTTLSQATQIVLDSWINQTHINGQYLEDGTNGYNGDVVVADVSLSGDMDNMNKFAVSLQGSGAITDV